MSKPPMSAKLARIVRTKDGALLRPRGEAAEYMTGLPAQRARYQAWQFAAKLLLGGDDAEALTRHAHPPTCPSGTHRSLAPPELDDVVGLA